MRDRRARAFVVAGLLALAGSLPAQVTLPHTEDASTPARGVLRFDVLSAWARVESRFGAGGVSPLGAAFTTDTLGVGAIPELDSIQTAIANLTGAPFTLDLGASRLSATHRMNVVPLGIEYGVTSRLSVGAVLPIVRQRIAVQFATTPYRFDIRRCYQTPPVVSPCFDRANVGPNPDRTSTLAAQANVLVQSQFADAAAQLSARLAACQADNTGSGCTAILADAPQLLQESSAFATGLAGVYGAGTGEDGLAFVPSSTSAAQATVTARIADFNLRYRTLLGASADVLTALPAAAGYAGPADIQNFLTAMGHDSLANLERLGYGDIEIGAKYRVLDRARDSLGTFGVQAALAASVRLPSGSMLAPSEIADVRLGTGRLMLDTRGIVDVAAGDFGLLADAHLGIAVSTPDSSRAAADKRVFELDLAPRWHLSGPYSLHAAYTMRSFDVTGTDQLVGGGVSYRSPGVFRRGSRALPIEVNFNHLEAISGTAGRPKIVVDEIQLRISVRALGR